MYQARILNKNRQLVAILPGVRWHYTRRINEATSIEIHIPRESIDEVITQNHPLYGFFAPSQPFAVQTKPNKAKPNKAQYAEIAAFIQIYKGGTLKASGKINSRTLGEIVTVSAYTEEILLEGNLTPAQYGKVWDGWDLADVARDLFDGWQSIRVKDKSQWQSYMVASSNVDLTTDPGLVTLAKNKDGQYNESGYIDLMFSSGEIRNFKAWDRIRWSADSEDPVKTSIQVSYDGSNWSQEFDGGLPEEVGYYVGGTEEQVYVRVNLSTTDTEAEDKEGNKVGVTPTVFAVELIARTERNELVTGNIPELAGVTVKGLSADYASTLQVLVQACEQVGWEFSVWNGALNIAENLGVDRTKDFVFRAGSNIEIQTLGDGDDDLVNILTAYGPGRGINRMEITLRDEASIAEFGEYPLAMEFEVESLAELQQKAQEFLSEHNSPKTQFEIAVAFEHGKEPEYALGDKVRVADPETGIVTTTRIMSETREYGENGLVVNLELGKAGFILAEAISGKGKLTKPLDPLIPTGVYARGIVAGIRVGFAEPKMDDWAYSEVHVSTAPHFEPFGGTLRDKGKQTRFDIVDLVPGGRYYARVIHVDEDGRKSPASTEVSAVAEHMPIELLPDHSIGVDKFMENLKPPIMVTSLPNLPDPRYTIGTSVFLTTDKKLYSTDGNTWEPVGAGTVTADEIVAGIITAGGIKADWYADIRNVLVYNYLDSLDSSHSLICDFYIPSETTDIKSVKLSAKGLPFRAYSRGASSGGGSTQTTTTHSSHTHSIGINQATGTTGLGASSITVKSSGGHSHSFSGSASGGDHNHMVVVHESQGHSHGATSHLATHTHTFSGTTGTDGSHGHSLEIGLHSHSFTYWRAESVSGSSDSHSHSVSLPAHTHDLIYGIYENTSPTDVRVRVDNGNGWGTWYTLGSGTTLASELDFQKITALKINGTGWKRMEFSSASLGRINANLIAKVDLTA